MRPSSAEQSRPASVVSRRPLSSTAPRPPSSQATRPSSSQGIRPSTSQAVRPSTSQGMRPSSSQGVRPSSSQGLRSQSSASMRPISRLTNRPQSRQLRANHLKLVSLCEQLVRNIKGDEDEEEFRASSDYVMKALSVEGTTLSKAGIGLDQKTADKMMRGHAQKARIHSRDGLAEALEKSYNHLKESSEKSRDFDQEIKTDHLPLHLQLLLSLANTPTPSTLAYASSYLHDLTIPPPEPEVLTWKKILEDDPFEGEHWEGVYGMPPGSIKNQRDGDSSDSDASSLWSLDSEARDLDASSESAPTPPRSPSPTPMLAFAPSLPDIRLSLLHRKEVEDLQSKQYWRSDWRMPIKGVRTRFDIGDASTLGPTLQNITGRNHSFSTELVHSSEKYIYEHDAVREVLIALQGRNNIMLEWRHEAYRSSRTTPRLLHLSLASQSSILSSLSEQCSCVRHLRNFVARVFSTPSSSKSKTRTLEAFADAVDAEIRLLDTWCADMEEKIVLATNGLLSEEGLVVSLLSLEIQVRDAFEGSFAALLSIVRDVFGEDHSPRASPSTTTAALLDRLFAVIQENLERGERVTAGVVMRVFVRSSEPLWGMLGRWLKDGMGVGDVNDLDDEFFIESNGLGSGAFGVGLLDPDYWAEGYTLRYEDDGDGRRKGLPMFFKPVAEMVLASGKAVGLLKALDLPPTDGVVEWRWRSLAELVAQGSGPEEDEASGLFSVSIDTLSGLIHDELAPYCHSMGQALSKTVAEECEFERHLNTIEDLYLMRKGDTMSHFCDVLLAKMDSQQHWSDFHFLNSTFNDVVEASHNVGVKEWVQLPLVRLSYRRSKDKTAGGRTVKALDGLLVEYAVPFPLVYVFTPRTMAIYGELFVFLLQIKRAKVALERILIRGDSKKVGSELKTFYAIRSRLSWFINALLDFLTTYVIHVQVIKFHAALKKVTALDELIRIHEEHLERIQERCLLHSNTAALHRSILSILDMALLFSDMFVTIAGDTTTHDISRASILTKRRRTKTQRRMRRNVIGFSGAPDMSSSESESESDEERMEEPQTSFSVAQSMEVSMEVDRLDKISSELDALVKFVRRGMESLSGGTTEAAATFGVIAFTLEDWDA